MDLPELPLEIYRQIQFYLSRKDILIFQKSIPGSPPFSPSEIALIYSNIDIDELARDGDLDGIRYRVSCGFPTDDWRPATNRRSPCSAWFDTGGLTNFREYNSALGTAAYNGHLGCKISNNCLRREHTLVA